MTTMCNGEVAYYDFDNFRLDVEKQQLLKNSEPVLLTHKAFQTLHILVQNCGQIVEKEDIYNQIWSDSFVEESNLTQYIYLLRKILDKNTAGVSYIETVARRGYVFTAQVEKIYVSESSAKALSEPVAAGNGMALKRAATVENAETIEPDFPEVWFFKDEQTHITENGKSEQPQPLDLPADEASGRHRRLTRLLLPLLCLAIIASISVGLFKYFQPQKTADANAPVIGSIAVLPFQPIGEESREGKLGLGMADAIITRLSKLQKIPVRPTSSIFRYIDQPSASLAATGRELGVDAVLEGTVQRDGERVRVSVQLVSVADGKSLWAETFDENFTNIFALQDSISGKVAQTVSLKLTPQQWKLLEQRPTDKPEALEAYQLGVYFWNTRTKDDLQKAVEYFQKAIEIDSNFAAAYAMLADSYNMLGYYRFADSREMASKARRAAEKALALDDSVAEAHIALAFLQLAPGNVEFARLSIERAIELAPYNSTARVRYAWILVRLGRIDEALDEMRLAQEYDPQSPISNGALCSVLAFRERFREAIAVCEKAVELSPETADNRLALANAYFFNGNVEEAISQVKIEIETSEMKFSALGSLGYFYAKLDRRADAEAIVAQLKAQVGKEAGLYNDLALISYALGRKDESFEHFQKAYKKRVVPAAFFRYDPVWKEVRAEPRFAKLMEE